MSKIKNNKVTYLHHNDFLAIWVGDEQVFYHHNSFNAALSAIFEKLELPSPKRLDIDVCDLVERHAFPKGGIHGLSLSEFYATIKEVEKDDLQREIDDLEAVISEKRNRLKNL